MADDRDARNLQQEHFGPEFIPSFVLIQLLLPGWWVAPVWIGGLVALWREARFRPFRGFAVAYVVLFVLLWVLVGDRPYYLGGLYPVLIAAGSIVADGVVTRVRRFLSERPPGRRLIWRSPRAAVTWVVVVGIVGLPLSLPILPASALAKVPIEELNYNVGEVVGWPQLTAAVAGAHRSLPGRDRTVATIVTENYGEAGAVDRYGSRFGLPQAYSGHNSEWWWGPPSPALGVTIAVGFGRGALTPYFRSVRLDRVFRSPSGIDNDENGAEIWVCTGPRQPWPAIWARFRHYG